ncbi:winged helix-turn-helix domain-containing protein [Dactylosporangium sp. CA-152071]|uniref:winged helix-turn-helix domain-containing protein n=1 Tax=Dactylosporangium sp. CA-152071 TaxID=3239933 RepID=UPI003D9208FC
MSAVRMPFRQRIAEEIKAKIRTGEYAPGAILPSRPQLAAEYGCSVEPVIRAQEDLERDGWIEIHQGKGVFVAERPPS